MKNSDKKRTGTESSSGTESQGSVMKKKQEWENTSRNVIPDKFVFLSGNRIDIVAVPAKKMTLILFLLLKTTKSKEKITTVNFEFEK